MARGKSNQDMFDRLRATGMRKRVAKTLSDATGLGNRKAPKRVQKAAAQLRAVASELEDRARGGPAKRKAAGTAKATRTRARNAKKRSDAAKRGAKTRAKASR